MEQPACCILHSWTNAWLIAAAAAQHVSGSSSMHQAHHIISRSQPVPPDTGSWGVQSTLLAAVLPLWAHPKLSAIPRLHNPVISIINSCTEGPASSSATAASVRGAGLGGAAAAHSPNPATVQQIVDMGFSAQRAEAALRRVRPSQRGGSSCQRSVKLIGMLVPCGPLSRSSVHCL